MIRRCGAAAGVIAASVLVLRAVACASFGTAAAPDSGSATTGEAASDARAGAAEASAPFCANRDASFCADFDESPDAGAGWSGLALGQSGVVSATSAAFVSSPSAFSSRVGADGGQARLQWAYPPTAHRTTLAFDIELARAATLSIGASLAIAELDCANATDAGLVDWGGVWLAGGTVADTSDPNLQLTAGGITYPLPNLGSGWSHVVLDVAWGPPTTHIKLTVDSTTLLDVDNGEVCDQKTDAFVLLGVASDFANEAIFDDVVVDVEP